MRVAWRRREDVLWRHVGSVLVLRPRERKDPAEPLVVTEPGAAVWELLDQRRSIDELVEAMGERDGDELEQVRHDLLELLRRLTAEGAVDAIELAEP